MHYTKGIIDTKQCIEIDYEKRDTTISDIIKKHTLTNPYSVALHYKDDKFKIFEHITNDNYADFQKQFDEQKDIAKIYIIEDEDEDENENDPPPPPPPLKAKAKAEAEAKAKEAEYAQQTTNTTMDEDRVGTKTHVTEKDKEAIFNTFKNIDTVHNEMKKHMKTPPISRSNSTDNMQTPPISRSNSNAERRDDVVEHNDAQDKFNRDLHALSKKNDQFGYNVVGEG